MQGGKRPGAGKPSLPQAEKRKNVTLRLSPASVQLCKELRVRGYQLGKLVDDLLEAFARHAGVIDSPPDLDGEL